MSVKKAKTIYVFATNVFRDLKNCTRILGHKTRANPMKLCTIKGDKRISLKFFDDSYPQLRLNHGFVIKKIKISLIFLKQMFFYMIVVREKNVVMDIFT